MTRQLSGNRTPKVLVALLLYKKLLWLCGLGFPGNPCHLESPLVSFLHCLVSLRVGFVVSENNLHLETYVKFQPKEQLLA